MSVQIPSGRSFIHLRCLLSAAGVLGTATNLLALVDGATISWRSLGLTGRVRTLTEQDVADVSPESPDGWPYQTRIYSFSTDDFAWSSEKEGAVTEKTVFVLQGPLIVQSHSESPDSFTRDTSYSRDTNGQVTELREPNGDLVCTTRISWGSRVEEQTQFCGDSPISRTTKRRNPGTGAFSVSYSDFLPDKGWIARSQYEEHETHSQDATHILQWVSKCNYRWTSDTGSRLLEELQDCPDSYHRATHKYNEAGWEAERAEWEHNNQIINRRTYICQMDSQGNWTRRTEWFACPPSVLDSGFCVSPRSHTLAFSPSLRSHLLGCAHPCFRGVRESRRQPHLFPNRRSLRWSQLRPGQCRL